MTFTHLLRYKKLIYRWTPTSFIAANFCLHPLVGSCLHFSKLGIGVSHGKVDPPLHANIFKAAEISGNMAPSIWVFKTVTQKGGESLETTFIDNLCYYTEFKDWIVSWILRLSPLVQYPHFVDERHVEKQKALSKFT